MGECLHNIEHEEDHENMNEEARDSLGEIGKVVMHKKMMVKKFMSTPIHDEQPEANENKKFKVRKFKTMQQKVTENIILVSPPTHNES